MTGQGHTRMDQIKANRPGVAIDLSLQYRTANGHLVRGLQFQHTNKLVHNGKEIITANNYRFIVGQVKMHSQETGTQEWLDSVWFESGVHISNKSLNLVVFKQQPVVQPNLF